MKKDLIYFDYAATTPVKGVVLDSMLPYFVDHYGNPSSAHNFGHEALKGVDESRGVIKDFFNCEVDEITFTSGATEANNLFLLGLVDRLRSVGEREMNIVTTSVEHPSVIEVCRELEKRGVLVKYLPVNSEGVVELKDVEEAIDGNTVIVSVMYVNNELGSVQPIRQIGKMVKKFNEKKEKEWRQARVAKRGSKPRSIVMHSDVTQGVNSLNCDMQWNYLDAVSFSGHKIYGPKGIGVLIYRGGESVLPIMFGGGQEMGRRSGTLNVPGIVSLGVALREVRSEESVKGLKVVGELKKLLVDGLSELEGVSVNGGLEDCVDCIANFRIDGVDAESLLIVLDMEGVAVSTGSACASLKVGGSHVLRAIGLKEDEVKSSIRVSFGFGSSVEEVERFLVILKKSVSGLRGVKN